MERCEVRGDELAAALGADGLVCRLRQHEPPLLGLLAHRLTQPADHPLERGRAVDLKDLAPLGLGDPRGFGGRRVRTEHRGAQLHLACHEADERDAGLEGATLAEHAPRAVEGIVRRGAAPHSDAWEGLRQQRDHLLLRAAHGGHEDGGGGGALALEEGDGVSRRGGVGRGKGGRRVEEQAGDAGLGAAGAEDGAAAGDAMERHAGQRLSKGLRDQLGVLVDGA
mmetsp:Transcript_26047/g.56257  ORF Transcript_26047/g.56257 Transcript_26047/m.56257 type:complete len:224 (-) Transcript_26047:361-1032(-)